MGHRASGVDDTYVYMCDYVCLFLGHVYDVEVYYFEVIYFCFTHAYISYVRTLPRTKTVGLLLT